MTAVASAATNPLAVFLRNARPQDKVPVPLQSTSFEIVIEAGLAVVTTTRLFRNAEESTIEATLTFPVPVHAVLFSLDLRIGDRHLRAAAKANEAARSSYEEGIEEGKTSILHEELLRGIHMLSVGNIPPGETIEVKNVWAMPLMMASGEGHLRIPTTIGQIYGQSPLADGDDFTWGDEVPSADVVVKLSAAPVRIGDKVVGTAPVQVRMNRPIELTVGAWQPMPLLSRTADGREITLELSPAPATSAALSVAVLVDHSGSMADGVSRGEDGATTVHRLVVSALKALSAQLSSEDFVDLWEFSDSARHVGQSSGNTPPLHSLVKTLAPPHGGTEIGFSLSAVLAATKAHSILLITDGKSHALDVQALVGRGKRVSVLLVGEDSLEAQVGHLAVLTGGDIFVSPKTAVDKVLAAALRSLRSPSMTVGAQRPVADGARELTVSGMQIRISRSGKSSTAARSSVEHAIAAVYANLELPHLSAADAARLAESEGLVTHLTSLVIVDQTAAAHDAIPLRRRVPLASPDVSFLARASQVSACVAPPTLSRVYMRTSEARPRRGWFERFAKPVIKDESVDDVFRANIDALADGIDWDSNGDALSKGRIDQVDGEFSSEILRLAEHTEVKLLAEKHSIEATRIVIMLLALRATARGNRSSSRVLKALRKTMSADAADSILAKHHS